MKTSLIEGKLENSIEKMMCQSKNKQRVKTAMQESIPNIIKPNSKIANKNLIKFGIKKDDSKQSKSKDKTITQTNSTSLPPPSPVFVNSYNTEARKLRNYQRKYNQMKIMR